MANNLTGKIEKIVVVMLENRSFDTALGYLYNETDLPLNHIPPLPRVLPPGSVPFEGLAFVDTSALANTAVHQGETISQIPEPIVRSTNSTGWDPGEEFEHVNAQIFDTAPTNNPDESAPVKMTGFLRDYSLQCDGDATAVKQIMHMFTPADLPVLNGLAKNYAVCDRWFSSVPTQTNANRAFSLTGTSNGLVDNGFLTTNSIREKLADDRFDVRTIWNVLHDNGKSSVSDWGVYWTDDYPLPFSGPYTRNIFPQLTDEVADGHFHPMEEFFVSAKAGTLPSFSYIEPKWGGYVLGTSVFGTDYHPPGDVTPGEHMLAQIYSSLSSNPESWAKTLLLIVFDEHGGTYDHVKPESAIAPWGDNTNPILPKGRQYNFNFDRFGARVPAILVSPLIEEKTVFRSETSVPFDHTSMIATILDWMDIPRSEWDLQDRVANAPTFDKVVTRTEPRTDNLFEPQAPKTGPINFGDPVTLQHSGAGEVVVSASNGYFGYYPQLAKSHPQDLDFRLGYGEVQNGDIIQIRTSEYLTPISKHSPGYFSGIRNFMVPGNLIINEVSYASPNDDTNVISGRNGQDNLMKTKWAINRISGGNGPIQYGDQVQLINQYTKMPLQKSGAYLSAGTSSSDYWTIRHKVWSTPIWVEQTKGTGGEIFTYSLTPNGQSSRPAGFQAFDKHYPTTIPIYAYTLAQAGGGYIWYYTPSPETPPSFSPQGVAFYAYAEENTGKSVPVYIYTWPGEQQYYQYSTNPTPPIGYGPGEIVFYAPKQPNLPQTVWMGKDEGTNGPIYTYSLVEKDHQIPASFKAYDNNYPTTIPIYAYTIPQAGGGYIWFYSTSSSAPPNFASQGVVFYAFAKETWGATLPVHQYILDRGQNYYFYSTNPSPPNGFQSGGIAFHAPV